MKSVRPLQWVPVILILLGSATCAKWTSIERDIDINKGDSVLIDVKQRAILVHKVPTPQGTPTPGMPQPDLVVCAEPSPDALSAYAADLAAKVSDGSKLSAALGLNTSEQASFVGLRTQSIQLLRDGFYRGCEAYMNGAINAHEYAFLVRRYQKYMIALLAIEQLTGAVQPKVVAVTAVVPTQSEGSDQKTTPTTGAGDGKTPAAGGGNDKAKTPNPAANNEPADGMSIGGFTRVSNADQNASPKTDPKNAGSKNQPTKNTTKDTSSKPTPTHTPTPKPTPSDMAMVAAVVRDITIDILDTDDFVPSCFAYMQDPAAKETPLGEVCHDAMVKLVAVNAPTKMLLANVAAERAKNAPPGQDDQLSKLFGLAQEQTMSDSMRNLSTKFQAQVDEQKGVIDKQKEVIDQQKNLLQNLQMQNKTLEEQIAPKANPPVPPPKPPDAPKQ